MEKRAFVIREVESRKFRCQDVYNHNEDYKKNIINARIYETEDEAEFVKKIIK